MVRKSWNVPQLITEFVRENANSLVNNPNTPRCRLLGSVRFTITLCAFLSMVLHVALRNMLGLVIMRMVKPRPEDTLLRQPFISNLTDLQCGSNFLQEHIVAIERSGDLPWTRSQELLFPGAFYYGYVVTLPLAGHLADKFGGKFLFIHSMTLQALAFIALPVMARHSFAGAVAMLVIAGLISGCGNPAMYQIFVVWSHPTERTRLLSFAYSGLILGSMLTYPITNFLSDYGWQTPFYVLGSMMLIFGICCHWLIYNSLEQHPRITAAERNYLKSTQSTQAPQQVSIPWIALLTSLPVYAFVLTHIFHNYVYLIIALAMPRFLREAMMFNMKETGLVSSAPFLGSLISKMLCVFCLGSLEQKYQSNLTYMRRKLYGLCNIITMCCFITIIYASCQQKTLVIVVNILLGLFTDIGFSAGYWPTLLYFAPSYAGFLSGLANSLANLSGFLTPYVISALVKTGTKDEWNILMLTMIIASFLGCIVFGTCSSSKLQSWDARSTVASNQHTNVERTEKITNTA